MKSEDTLLYEVKSVEQQHILMGIGKPKHPLISLQRFADVPQIKSPVRARLISDKKFSQTTKKPFTILFISFSRANTTEKIMSLIWV